MAITSPAPSSESLNSTPEARVVSPDSGRTGRHSANRLIRGHLATPDLVPSTSSRSRWCLLVDAGALEAGWGSAGATGIANCSDH